MSTCIQGDSDTTQKCHFRILSGFQSLISAVELNCLLIEASKIN